MRSLSCSAFQHTIIHHKSLKDKSTKELFVKFLKEGQNHGFDPSVRNISINRSLESIVKVG